MFIEWSITNVFKNENISTPSKFGNAIKEEDSMNDELLNEYWRRTENKGSKWRDVKTSDTSIQSSLKQICKR